MPFILLITISPPIFFQCLHFLLALNYIFFLPSAQCLSHFKQPILIKSNLIQCISLLYSNRYRNEVNYICACWISSFKKKKKQKNIYLTSLKVEPDWNRYKGSNQDVKDNSNEASSGIERLLQGNPYVIFLCLEHDFFMSPSIWPTSHSLT